MNGRQTLTNQMMNLRLKTLISGGTPRHPACSRKIPDVSYHEYFLLPIARSAPKIENYDSQLLILLASCYSGFSRIKFGGVVCWCLFTSVSPNLNLCTLMILEILCRFTWVIFHMR